MYAKSFWDPIFRDAQKGPQQVENYPFCAVNLEAYTLHISIRDPFCTLQNLSFAVWIICVLLKSIAPQHTICKVQAKPTCSSITNAN